jgi:hypothetical protein
MPNAFSLRVAGPVVAAFLLFASAVPAWAQGAAQSVGTSLFRDLRYDAPIRAFGEAQGYYDCSADIGMTARCLDDVKFLGHSFGTQILVFVDDRLRSVQLAAEFKPEIYLSLMKALAEGFTLIMLQSDDRRFDVIETARKEGEVRLRARLSEFESIGLKKGDLTYSFIERPARALKDFPNGVEAMLKSPPETRLAEIVVWERENEAGVSVQFSLPRVALEAMRAAPASKEKF